VKPTLHANRSVLVITGTGIVEITSNEATVDSVGQKALGLLTIPPDWTTSFFVVLDQVLTGAHSETQLQSWLDQACERSRVGAGNVMIRSNGVEEGLLLRGALTSSVSSLDRATQTLFRLRAEALKVTTTPTHWVIQDEVKIQARGQLSNERRVRYEKRDWAIEVEAMGGKSADQVSIAVRRWRDGHDLSDGKLDCSLFLNLTLTLKKVAMWAVQDERRFLFEWVWDGKTIYLVQMDVASTAGGDRPKDLLPAQVPLPTFASLLAFIQALPAHKIQFRKLANASLYERLGYTMPPFYIVDGERGLFEVIATGTISDNLRKDLENLTQRPLVLRTDGSDIPHDKQDMLPRSEELRSLDAAIGWLLGTFRRKILDLGLQDSSLALIGHHFIPSVAATWAGAEPGKRWVRIESLWGIPESLYWHSHDTFEVDTESADLSGPLQNDSAFPVRERLRYKGTFIAPDSNGAWVHHQTAIPYDWSPTVSSRKMLHEIAQTTRRICEELRKPVEVMWFVETHKDATSHRVLPWYHSSPENLEAPNRAPRKKIKTSQERYLRNTHDWRALQQAVQDGSRIERVIVEPTDPELVRNPKFADELGCIAAKHDIVVVLAGGILSHAYHALRRAGAAVECIDLFGDTEDRAEYNKVIRDKIPAQIEDRGEHYEVVRLQGDALVVALRRKLVEEALEALDASTGADLVGELADVEEVLRAITKAIDVTHQQLEEERLRKLKKRGAFDCGYMLRTTSSPHSLSKPVDYGPLNVNFSPSMTIVNPSNLPQKAVYRRPDHRHLPDSREELLVVEIELSRLGKLIESVNFDIPPSEDPLRYTSSIELSRSRGELRAVIKLRSRSKRIDVEEQLDFDF
jgi:predicted house-cleaning noncanonical NTP pyrophosphatase (MazG superfamily)